MEHNRTLIKESLFPPKEKPLIVLISLRQLAQIRDKNRKLQGQKNGRRTHSLKKRCFMRKVNVCKALPIEGASNWGFERNVEQAQMKTYRNAQQ